MHTKGDRFEVITSWVLLFYFQSGFESRCLVCDLDYDKHRLP